MNWGRYGWALVLLAGLGLIAAMLSWYASTVEPPSSPSVAAYPELGPAGFPAEAPAPQPEDVADNQQGFSALVSFTGNSFEPSALVIYAGERIRFTNNSTSEMRIIGGGPLVQLGSVSSHNYAEVAFPQKGTWNLIDAGSGSMLVITVQ